MAKRKTHALEFKSKDALEAIREAMTLASFMGFVFLVSASDWLR